MRKRCFILAQDYISAHSGLSLDNIVSYVDSNKDKIALIPSFNDKFSVLQKLVDNLEQNLS